MLFRAIPLVVKLFGYFLLLSVIGAPVRIVYIIWMRCTEFAITNKRLILKKGWIMRKTEEIRLNRIEEVNLHQSITGRILGYGRLQVRGTGGSGIRLPQMARPLEFRQALLAGNRDIGPDTP